MDTHSEPLSPQQCEALNAILEELWEIEFTPAWNRETFNKFMARARAITSDATHFKWLYSAATPEWWNDPP